MGFLGLRTTIYKIGNITEAKAWYSDIFETKPYFDEPFYVGFNIMGYELGLIPDDSTATDKSEGVVAYWGVNDIEAAYNRMILKGAVAHEAPRNVGGEIMVGSIKDPWGNIIGLIYNPEFSLS